MNTAEIAFPAMTSVRQLNFIPKDRAYIRLLDAILLWLLAARSLGPMCLTKRRQTHTCPKSLALLPYLLVWQELKNVSFAVDSLGTLDTFHVSLEAGESPSLATKECA